MDFSWLSAYLSFLPSFLLCVVGIVLTIVFWSRCPGACAMTLIGLIVILLLNLVQPILQRWILEGGGPDRGTVISSFFFVMGLLRTGAFALVLAAVFMGRSAPAPVYGMPHNYGQPMANMPTPMPPMPPLPAAPLASESAKPAPGNYGITSRPSDMEPRS